MEQRIIYVGLDVHKDTIAVALAGAGKRGAARVWQVMAGAFDFAMRPALAVTAFSAS